MTLWKIVPFVFVIGFFIGVIIYANNNDKDWLHKRCHASLIMAKTPADTLKFLNTDRACYTTLPDSLK